MKKQAFVRWAIVLTVVLVVGGLLVATLLPDDTLYVAPDKSFSLRLPSSEWKKSKEPPEGLLVSFVNDKKSAVLAVEQVISENQDGFKRKSADIKKQMTGKGPKPEIIDGKTNDRGNPYLLVKAIVATRDGRLAYVARAFIWCSGKGKTVSLFLNGALQATNEVELAEERVFLDKSIDAIVNSVE